MPTSKRSPLESARRALLESRHRIEIEPAEEREKRRGVRGLGTFVLFIWLMIFICGLFAVVWFYWPEGQY